MLTLLAHLAALMAPRHLARLAGLLLAILASAVLLATPAYAADGITSSPALLDTASWTLLASVVVPLVTSVVQQPRWTGALRTVIGVVGAVIIAFITLLANGTLNDGPQTVLSIVALAVVTSAASYKAIWQPSGVAPKIENATSPTPPSAPDPGGRV